MRLFHFSTVLCSPTWSCTWMFWCFVFLPVLLSECLSALSPTVPGSCIFPVSLPVSRQFSFPDWFSSRLAFVLTCSCSWTLCVPCLRWFLIVLTQFLTGACVPTLYSLNALYSFLFLFLDSLYFLSGSNSWITLCSHFLQFLADLFPAWSSSRTSLTLFLYLLFLFL